MKTTVMSSILVLIATVAITAVAGNHDGKASKVQYVQYVYEAVPPQQNPPSLNLRMHNQFTARDNDDTIVTASPTLYPTYLIITDDDDTG
jgi:hypothetical protein